MSTVQFVFNKYSEGMLVITKQDSNNIVIDTRGNSLSLTSSEAYRIRSAIELILEIDTKKEVN